MTFANKMTFEGKLNSTLYFISTFKKFLELDDLKRDFVASCVEALNVDIPEDYNLTTLLLLEILYHDKDKGVFLSNVEALMKIRKMSKDELITITNCENILDKDFMPTVILIKFIAETFQVDPRSLLIPRKFY